jgi:SAM-dependent methyltransferase
MKQVDKSHYKFQKYMGKRRWNSVWHQLDEVISLAPKSILEVGPGPGLFKVLAMQFGLQVKTLDLDPELKPDYVGSATDIPLPDSSFDLVCAFQMLEHLPYDDSLRAFGEMVRVSRKYLVISLPDASTAWRYQIYVPKLGIYDALVTRPTFKNNIHIFDGEHYWEINKKGYELEKIIADLTKFAKLIKTYRVKENPYHRFFIFAL